jgi:hypothetical protein
MAEQRSDVLVTFGVVPDHASTGFGYLELGETLDADAHVVSTFPREAFAGSRFRLPRRRTVAVPVEQRHVRLAAETLLRAVDAFVPESAAVLRAMGAAYGRPPGTSWRAKAGRS